MESIMEREKERYFTLVTLIQLFQSYIYNSNQANGEKIIQYIKQYLIGEEIPLPNGQYGDALALATMMGYDDVVTLLCSSQFRWQSQLSPLKECSINDRNAYLQFATLVFYLRRYGRVSSQAHTRDLLQFVNTTGNVWMPLPSGYYGNAIAVAFEMQLYAGAYFLLEHQDQLDLDTEVVAINCDDKTMSAENSFDFSLSYLPREIGRLNYQCGRSNPCRTISNIKWIEAIKDFLLENKTHVLYN
jgi:hypothetical protein